MSERDEACALWDRGGDVLTEKGDGVDGCADELEAVLNASPWIPVAERLPDAEGWHWIQSSTACLAYYDGNEWRNGGQFFARVAYWQSSNMPEPYEEPT